MSDPLSLCVLFQQKLTLAKRVVEIEGLRGCAWTWLAPQVMEVILLILLQLPNIYIYIYIWVEFWTLEYGILSSSHFPTQCFNFFRKRGVGKNLKGDELGKWTEIFCSWKRKPLTIIQQNLKICTEKSRQIPIYCNHWKD